MGNRANRPLIVEDHVVAFERLANFIGLGQIQVVLPLSSEGLNKEMTANYEQFVKIRQYILDWIVDAENRRK